MTKFYPPMHELVSFEACARHRNFTEAADELAVTVSAVSKQVQSLEQRLGVMLFRRSAGRATLTEAGEQFLARVRPALELIGSAALDVLSRAGESSTLNLSVLPTFAAKWLITRLPEFSAQHPQITINLKPHLRSQEGMPADVDAAIRFGPGVWPGCRSDYLVGKELVAVCAPAWYAKQCRAHGPAGFLGATLLHHVSSPLAWGGWLAQAKVKCPEALPGPRFEQYALMIQAAMAGMGVALVPSCFVEDELASRQLIEPFPIRVVRSEIGYYLVWREEATPGEAQQKFHAWIRATARTQP